MAGSLLTSYFSRRLPYSKLAPSWICLHIGPLAAAPSAPAAARLATLRAASFISKATSKVFSSKDACSGTEVCVCVRAARACVCARCYVGGLVQASLLVPFSNLHLVICICMCI